MLNKSKSSSDSENSRDCHENGESKTDNKEQVKDTKTEESAIDQSNTVLRENEISMPSMKIYYNSSDTCRLNDHSSNDTFGSVPQAIIQHSICPRYCDVEQQKDTLANIVAHLQSGSENPNIKFTPLKNNGYNNNKAEFQSTSLKRSLTQEFNTSDDSNIINSDASRSNVPYFYTLPTGIKNFEIDFNSNLSRYSQSSLPNSNYDCTMEHDHTSSLRSDMMMYQVSRSESNRSCFGYMKSAMTKFPMPIELSKSSRSKQSRSLDFNNSLDADMLCSDRNGIGAGGGMIKESMSFDDNPSISIELARDQNGSRLIQQRIETADQEEISLIIGILTVDSDVFVNLVGDVFGNYVIQKLLEYGNENHRKSIVKKISGCILSLSVQMYGCRVIQKAIECGGDNIQSHIVIELRNHVLDCIKDQNGNHVIQKCIEKIPSHMLHFIIVEITGKVVELSSHPYGCRVIQRILEHFNDSQRGMIADELFEQIPILILDQYGNYVIQHILDHCIIHGYRQFIFSYVTQHLLELSSHKFASNVVEKCLVSGSKEERLRITREIIDNSVGLDSDIIFLMMKDAYANYVVQKLIDVMVVNQEVELFQEFVLKMRPHISSLRRVNYGKHIINKVEKISQKNPRLMSRNCQSFSSTSIPQDINFTRIPPSARLSQDISSDMKDFSMKSVICDNLTEFPSLIRNSNEMPFSFTE